MSWLRAGSTQRPKTLQPRGGGFTEKRKRQESDRRPSADARICGQEEESCSIPTRPRNRAHEDATGPPASSGALVNGSRGGSEQLPKGFPRERQGKRSPAPAPVPAKCGVIPEARCRQGSLLKARVSRGPDATPSPAPVLHLLANHPRALPRVIFSPPTPSEAAPRVPGRGAALIKLRGLPTHKENVNLCLKTPKKKHLQVRKPRTLRGRGRSPSPVDLPAQVPLSSINSFSLRWLHVGAVLGLILLGWVLAFCKHTS